LLSLGRDLLQLAEKCFTPFAIMGARHKYYLGAYLIACWARVQTAVLQNNRDHKTWSPAICVLIGLRVDLLPSYTCKLEKKDELFTC
jgi:hypothetical protein